MRSDRLLIILLVAFSIRFLFSIPVGLNLANDAGDYYQLASGLTAGEGYVEPDNGLPSAYRPPAYPAFLAALLLIFNFYILPIQVVQALLGALLVGITYLIAKRVFGTGPAMIAAAIVCFYPDLVVYSSLLFSETLYNILFYSAVLLLLALWTSWVPRIALVFPAGVLIGVATLARSEALGLVALLFVIGVFQKRLIWAMILVGMVALVTVSPWVVRNVLVMETPTVSTNSGVNFWIGNHSGASGSYDYPEEDNPVRNPELTETERNQVGFSESFRFIRSEPGAYATLLAKKLFKFIRPIGDLVFVEAKLPASKLLFGLSAIAFEVVLILSIMGMALARDSKAGRTVMLMVVVLYALTNILIMTMPRLRLPLVPAMAVFAGAGLTVILAEGRALFRPPLRKRFIVGLAVVVAQIVAVGVHVALRLPGYLERLGGWEG